MSGSGFEGHQIYTCYEVVLPSEWILRTGNLSDDIAEKDFMKDQGKLGKQLLLGDGYADGDEAEGMQRGSTALSSAADNWRGGVHLPKNFPKWFEDLNGDRYVIFICDSRRGYHFGRSFSRYSGILLGLSFFLITIVAIVLVSVITYFKFMCDIWTV